MPDDLLTNLRSVTNTTVRSAGPRYSPAFAPGSPNLSIETLDRTVSAQCLSSQFRARISSLAIELRAGRAVRGYTARDVMGRRKVTFDSVAADLDSISLASTSVGVRSGFLRLKRHVRLIQMVLEAERNRLGGELHQTSKEQLDLQDPPGSPSRRTQIGSRMQALEDLDSALYPVSDMMNRNEGLTAPEGDPVLLLGEWGTGKTHFACDFALAAIDDGVPAVAVLAAALDGGEPLDELAAMVGLSGQTSLLDELETAAVVAGRRALILIDAINEGDRVAWRRHFPKLLAVIGARKHIALVLTCRTPFDTQIVPADSRSRMRVLYHPGFEDQEFDAQLEFFEFYGLPVLHVPLLSAEFARPLFLKLLCEGLIRLSKRTQKRHLDGISSGQKGMTYVLENFVGSVGKEIEARHGLAKMACWYLLKGDLGKGHLGIAGRLAELRREWLSPSDVIDEVGSQFGLTGHQAVQLVRDMVASGLLVEQMRYSDGAYVEGMALPYQRFSDHLVARHLLASHLDVTTEDRLRRSFYSNRRLGAVFSIERSSRSFAEPGIASALMVEFPERAKKLGTVGDLPELVNYLPRPRRLLYPIADAFIDGLYWRDAPSFGSGTAQVVNVLLARKDAEIANQLLEVLLGIAARREHPWNGAWLWARLAPMEMTRRDLLWSEFVRFSEESSNVFRLLAWAERPAARSADAAVLGNQLKLLALMTTTTERLVRDRATRAMVLLGEAHPRALFELAVEALAFNDPYVKERVLAAAYGVALRNWALADRSSEFDDSLKVLARQLLTRVLEVDAPDGTWHTLARSYAEGIVQVLGMRSSRLLRPNDKVHLIRSPAASEIPFRPIGVIADEDVVDGESTIHMDFGNYTMGRLVDDRGNYDMDNSEYVGVRRQIADRIGRLGYREAEFQRIDQIIARYSGSRRDGNRTDRYGKKYSWIAYFEMYGVRSRSGLLKDFPLREPRSTDVDIDPSFPAEPPDWQPPLPDVFASSPVDHAQWLSTGQTPNYASVISLPTVDGLSGGWVLLDAVFHEGVEDGRETQAWVTTAFVPQRSVGSVGADFAAHAPQHRDLPEPGTDFYTFLGEVPWSKRFGSDIRRADGKPRTLNERALDYYEGGRWRAGFRAEATSRIWGWEGYHSALNDLGNVYFPSPSFADFHSLRGVSGSADLIDKEGRVASIFRRHAGPMFGSAYLYVRKDLVENYLASRSLRLVTVIRGERTLHYDRFDRPLPDAIQSSYQSQINDFGTVLGLD